MLKYTAEDEQEYPELVIYVGFVQRVKNQVACQSPKKRISAYLVLIILNG